MVFPISSPMPTTNAAGTFLKTTAGYIQGTALNDPAVRFALSGGILGPNETIPMWGGVGISESVTPVAASGLFPVPNLGGYITRATTLALNNSPGTLNGFSVFDQDHAMLNNPQSPVPTANLGMLVNFYRLGSGARIAVQIDPTYAAGILGGNTTQQSSWDFNDQLLQQYDASTATYSITSQTWSSTNGGQVAVVMGSASPTTGVGDIVNVSGATNTGTGNVALINTSHVVNTWTDASHFTYLLPGTSTIWGTFGGTQVLNYGTGLLNVKILDIQLGNSMTVVYNPVTGNCTWQYAGNTAIILI
jgi:hypothetical protein